MVSLIVARPGARAATGKSPGDLFEQVALASWKRRARSEQVIRVSFVRSCSGLIKELQRFSAHPSRRWRGIANEMAEDHMGVSVRKHGARNLRCSSGTVEPECFYASQPLYLAHTKI